MHVSKRVRDCWCGNTSLEPFSHDYGLCRACGTVVSLAELADEAYLVQNDETDFYGKQYWLNHQADQLGLPQIQERARLDLPERCLYWLRHLLRYRLPPAKVLELGCAHGGFVALMRWAGFDATGLEMSPWVADLARRTFQVPMRVGPIEQQDFIPGSYDVVVAHDVMEHLPDPLTTLRQAIKLLKPAGILMIQMPEYPDGKSFAELSANNNRFLLHLHKEEHLYLYSRRAAQECLKRLGMTTFRFEKPIFDYDMYFVAGRQRLVMNDLPTIQDCLLSNPTARLVLSTLELAEREEKTRVTYEVDRVQCQADIKELHRALEERLDMIKKLNGLLGQAQQKLAIHEADLAARQQSMDQLTRRLAAAEAIGQSRLQTIAEMQHNIRAQQKALAFLRKVLEPQPLWLRLPKKLVKMVVPFGVRHALRMRLKRPPSDQVTPAA
jgi:2-polyprenyl-3-methyl-5-hydroxy-6-metoxy-1,4-benzoquinol methylase